MLHTGQQSVVNAWNFQVLITSAVKICKQCLQLLGVSSGLSVPNWGLLSLGPLGLWPSMKISGTATAEYSWWMHVVTGLNGQWYHPEAMVNSKLSTGANERVCWGNILTVYKVNIPCRRTLNLSTVIVKLTRSTVSVSGFLMPSCSSTNGRLTS